MCRILTRSKPKTHFDVVHNRRQRLASSPNTWGNFSGSRRDAGTGWLCIWTPFGWFDMVFCVHIRLPATGEITHKGMGRIRRNSFVNRGVSGWFSGATIWFGTRRWGSFWFSSNNVKPTYGEACYQHVVTRDCEHPKQDGINIDNINSVYYFENNDYHYYNLVPAQSVCQSDQ